MQILVVASLLGIVVALIVFVGAVVARNLPGMGAGLVAMVFFICLAFYFNAEHQRQQQQQAYDMPERIDASPEEIAQRVLRQKPKKNWRYLEKEEEEEEKP